MPILQFALEMILTLCAADARYKKEVNFFR